MACYRQIATGSCGGGDHDYTKMADTIVVPNNNEDDQRQTNGNRKQQPGVTWYGQEASSDKDETACSSRQLEEGVFSERALQLIDDSTRMSTKTKYESIRRKWQGYCEKNDVGEMATTVTFGNFIALEYDRNLKYTYLRSYRSALQDYVKNVDMNVIKKLMKGIHNHRPPTARYCAIWDVKVVLDYLSAMRTDSFMFITMKTVTLLMLLSGNRVNMLSKFRMSNMTLSDLECTFVFTEVLKHSREGYRDAPITFRAYPDNGSLCPVQMVIKCLEFRAEKSGYDEFFVITVREHTPAHHDTIENCIERLLCSAGINTRVVRSDGMSENVSVSNIFC